MYIVHVTTSGHYCHTYTCTLYIVHVTTSGHYCHTCTCTCTYMYMYNEHTSIFLPSTTFPFNSTRALVANSESANVTNPKPFEPRSLNIISISTISPYP